MDPLKHKVRILDFAKNFNFVPSPILENTFIQGLKLYRKKKKLVLHLKSFNILKEEELLLFTKQFKNSIQNIEEIEINVEYCYKYHTIEELVKINWDNILFILKKDIPAISAISQQINWELCGNNLSIIINEPFISKKAKDRKIEKKIEKYFAQSFNESIKCQITLKDDFYFDLLVYEEQKEKESLMLMDKIIKDTTVLENNKQQNSKFKKEMKDTSSPLLYGKNFSGSPIPLKDIIGDLEDAIIEGEVFSIEEKTLSSGKNLLILQVTDYTNSITVKVFEGKYNLTDMKEKVSIGDNLRIKGNIVYDKFLKENILMASDILLSPKTVRKDTADTKRIELHLHTQMSSMDGVSNISNLVRTAANWGHKAIAVTDHGVVQAFPEAMEAAKKYGIKIIYGVEGYLVNDDEKLIELTTSEDYSLDDEYIVFDLETTGLSSQHDKITEIGAVKIKNQKIVDTFSTLVNPQTSIPEKVVELTGITDEMVKNAPTIEKVLPEFLHFVGDGCLVAHNADFDIGFLRENLKKYGYKMKNIIVDTLKISRVLLSNLKKHKLNLVAKELNVSLENHHRAVDDAMATAEVFIKLIEKMKERKIYTLQDINKYLGEKVDIKKLNTYHVVLLVKNQNGLKNLYKIISESHLNYFYKKPRIPKSLLNRYREGIIVGSACESGELFQLFLNNSPDDVIERTSKYYDYLEIQPLGNNKFLVDKGILNNYEDLININRKIVEIGEKLNIPVVATGDVHFLNKHDEYYRRILMAGQGYSDADEQAPLYFKTTDEMLKEFAYLGEEKAKEVVVVNTNKINDMIEELIPIPEGTFPPEIEGSEEELRRLCYSKAESIYGNPLPNIVKDRLDREVNSIIKNGYAVMYIIAHKLVAKSLKDGYLVGSRGSVGSSFAATMSDITEVNPLPPHYVCLSCKYSEFITDGSYGSGVDLPDKKCPKCNQQLIKDGHDIPFEVFLGFEADKEPDIDLNFAGEYQSEAHKYTEELFGKGKVFRAGTIGTIADKTAYGFVKKYLEEKQLDCNQAEINRLTMGCTGVKRTSGQHPGGVMIVPRNKDIHDFCPIQYPANDVESGVITTHFDYHSISGRLLKLDILGHDVPTIIKMLEDITKLKAQNIPLDDKKTMSIFTSTDALGIENEDFKYEVGTLGIPEFGTKFVRQMLIETQPKTFSELVRISGLSHGTDVWINNAQELVRNNIAELKDVISTRDDIMNYLILKGLPSKEAFKIMENVRKGKGLKPEDEELMKKNNVPQWYIDSCNKIKYMFPKAHAVAYVMMSFRIAYFKVHFPQAFYATYFTMKAEDFDADLIAKGKDIVAKKIIELENKGNNMTAKEKNLLTVLEVALEMYCRGIEVLPVNLYESDANKFIIKDNKLLPPLRSLQGVGQNAANSIALERLRGEFLSIEDLRQRTRVTKTVIDTLMSHGCIEKLPETNQLCLF